MGELPAQPRRDRPRPPDRGGARRRSSPRSGRSRRCSSTTAASAAGSRRCSAATRAGSSWRYSLHVRAAGHAGALVRRRDRHGRRPLAAGAESVRTPMQWSRQGERRLLDRAGGEARSGRSIAEGPFDYRKINVAAQRDVSGSLMEHMQRLVRTRRSCPEIGWGEWRVLETGETGVLALVLRMARQHGRDAAQPGGPKGGGEAAGRGKLPPELTPLLCDDNERNPCRRRNPIGARRLTGSGGSAPTGSGD